MQNCVPPQQPPDNTAKIEQPEVKRYSELTMLLRIQQIIFRKPSTVAPTQNATQRKENNTRQDQQGKHTAQLLANTQQRRQEKGTHTQQRHRRSANEINRHYRCPYSECNKSYGSEGSVNQHIKLKHGDVRPKTKEEQCEPAPLPMTDAKPI